MSACSAFHANSVFTPPLLVLSHHGSDPLSLVDPAFAEGLGIAGHLTLSLVRALHPVNEPLTTARFSGYCGHWYPHGREMVTFFAGAAN